MIEKIATIFFVSSLFFHMAIAAHGRETPFRDVPLPQMASPQMQKLIGQAYPSWWHLKPSTTAEWKKLAYELAGRDLPKIADLKKKLKVKSNLQDIGGVPCYILTPEEIAPQNVRRVLIYLHGGGYTLGPAEAGTKEAIMMAAWGKIEVVAPDYRLAPEHPFPAALDDALAVYRKLLKSWPATNIGVFGTSAGGALVLALVLKAREEGLPFPGAIAAGTPWSDISKIGDSYYINEGMDNVLVSYDGWLKEAAKAYIGNENPQNPLISPVYGNVRGFPPTLVITGSRDLFLSNSIRMHQKLREADVQADLLAIEGLSHAQYMMDEEASETVYYFRELQKFFDKNLGR